MFSPRIHQRLALLRINESEVNYDAPANIHAREKGFGLAPLSVESVASFRAIFLSLQQARFELVVHSWTSFLVHHEPSKHRQPYRLAYRSFCCAYHHTAAIRGCQLPGR